MQLSDQIMQQIKVIWQSKDPNIAEVDDNGNITGINEGNTVVTAKTEDWQFSASCNITVNLKGIRLTKSRYGDASK